MRRWIGALALLPALLFLPGSLALADRPVNVRIKLPVAAKMDSQGMRRILVGGFLHNDSPVLDIEGEMVDLLRQELDKFSDFVILDDPAPSLPEQRLPDLKENALFFQAIADDFRADLIISGQVIFGSVDRSGFVTQEYISPVSGRRTIRSVYVDRVGYTLKLDLIFVRGSDGTVLYDTTLLQDEIVNMDEGDALGVFFHLADRFRATFLGILLPMSRTETRYLFTE